MILARVADGFDIAVARFTADRREASLVSQIRSFAKLSIADQAILSNWLGHAQARGIDAVDLSARPWNLAGVTAIVGIFERNRSEATWLVIRCGGGWMLAACSDGWVSDVSVELSDILALVGPPDGCPSKCPTG